MKKIIAFLITSWLFLAIIMSLFWGIRGIILFAKSRNFWWKSYQFIFNFVGSFAGWFCFYALLIKAQNNITTFLEFDGSDFILFIISLLGLTGHLPQTLYGFVESFSKIAEKTTEKLLK